MEKKNLKQLILRLLAVFSASGLAGAGVGILTGLEAWEAVLLAGIGGVSGIVTNLARAYSKDGDLTSAEIDDAFDFVDDCKDSRDY